MESQWFGNSPEQVWAAALAQVAGTSIRSRDDQLMTAEVNLGMTAFTGSVIVRFSIEAAQQGGSNLSYRGRMGAFSTGQIGAQSRLDKERQNFFAGIAQRLPQVETAAPVSPPVARQPEAPSTPPSPLREVLASGLVNNSTTLRIYNDGTFTTSGLFAAASKPDRLLSFDHDLDSMRRKSVTGRGSAALATSGLSLLASNNRGVIYVTITGQNTGARTFTTRNPSGTTLTSIRRLKSAAESLLAQKSQPQAITPPAVGDISAQLKQLAELHASGALSDDEFAAAKARLLS